MKFQPINALLPSGDLLTIRLEVTETAIKKPKPVSTRHHEPGVPPKPAPLPPRNFHSYTCDAQGQLVRLDDSNS